MNDFSHCPCALENKDDCINRDDVDIITLENLDNYDTDQLVILASKHCMLRTSFLELLTKIPIGDPVRNPFTREWMYPRIVTYNNQEIMPYYPYHPEQNPPHQEQNNIIDRTHFNLFNLFERVPQRVEQFFAMFALLVIMVYDRISFRGSIFVLFAIVLSNLVNYTIYNSLTQLSIVDNTTTFEEFAINMRLFFDMLEVFFSVLNGGNNIKTKNINISKDKAKNINISKDKAKKELTKFIDYCDQIYRTKFESSSKTPKQFNQKLKKYINDTFNIVLKLKGVSVQSRTFINNYLKLVNNKNIDKSLFTTFAPMFDMKKRIRRSKSNRRIRSRSKSKRRSRSRSRSRSKLR